MKKLFDYLPKRIGPLTLEEYCRRLNLDIDNLTNNEIDDFYRKREVLQVDENLQSHTSEKLIRFIKSRFDVVKITANNPETRDIIEMFVSKEECLYDGKDFDNKFKDCLKFYNYYVTYIEEYDDVYKLYLEPIFTDKILGVKKVYHVCENKHLQSIMRSGLRPKTGKRELGTYRYFPERVFLIVDSNDWRRDIQEVVNDLELCDYSILEIDISKYKISLFRDLASNNKHCVYTYESIPSRLIKII